MKTFFGDDILLESNSAKTLYEHVKDLPIIDYHCHLNQVMIKNDSSFSDIGELWLAGDHYKWRAMRLAGVDEKFITGDASYKDKFLKYCEILPKCINNPLYFWSHLELKQVFGINLEINKDNAEAIYNQANTKLKDLSVRKLLKKFNVEFIATTDDPVDNLADHGTYDGIKVTPTFRGDKLLNLNRDYISKIEEAVGFKVATLDDLEKALMTRIDYFKSKGCKITDHGFKDFPEGIYSKEEASKAFLNLDNLDEVSKSYFTGYLFRFLLKEYKRRNLIVQLHFAVTRNINTPEFKLLGPDHGFDVMSKEIDIDNLIKLLDSIEDKDRPTIVLYTLNPNSIKAISCISGAFRNVLIGPAWWFNDSVGGIKYNLDVISEYAILGTNFGMLTDSRSFSSYSRFDFFRRILCNFVGEKIEKGEYSLDAGLKLVEDISYNNIKKALGE